MRNIILMLRNNFSRNLGALILMAACLVILSCSLNAGNLFTTNDTIDTAGAPIGFLDYDESDLSKDLETYLKETLKMEIHTPNSLNTTRDKAMDTMTDLLINKEISAIIEVPKGFEMSAIAGNMKELTYTSLEDYENAAFLKIYLDTYMSKVEIVSKSAVGEQKTFLNILHNSNQEVSELLCADKHTLELTSQQSGFALGAGIFMVLSMGIAVFTALTVFDDRVTGTYSRMQISPLKPSEYIIGTTLAGILTGLLFDAGFLGVIKVKGISMGVPLWLFVVMLILFTLFSVGFALIISLIINSKGIILTIITCTATLFAILGGAWFPVDKQQILLSRIAALIPHYWFMELIRSIQKNPDYAYGPCLIMLALFAALSYFIAAALFTKKQ